VPAVVHAVTPAAVTLPLGALMRRAQVDVGSKAPSVLFDYPQLLKCPVEGLAWAISERPQEAIPCLGIAVHEALFVDRWGARLPAAACPCVRRW
jgi:hypothetical protein